jgi:hypothetical protein
MKNSLPLLVKNLEPLTEIVGRSDALEVIATAARTAMVNSCNISATVQVESKLTKV